MPGRELDCTGTGAEASSCFWLTEKEKGGEVEQQAVIEQEVEPETVIQPEPEPSEDLEGLGLPVTSGRCENEGFRSYQDFRFFILVMVSFLQMIPYGECMFQDATK